MTIEEVRIAREELSQQIFNLVKNFQIATGVQIERINLDTARACSDIGHRLMGIDIEISL